MHEDEYTVPPPQADSWQGLTACIRVSRKLLNLSPKRFAKLVGVDQCSVSRWKSGAALNDAHILKLAEIARVELAAFGRDPRAEGESPFATKRPAAVPVVGHVGAGQEIFSYDDHALGGDPGEVFCGRFRGTRGT